MITTSFLMAILFFGGWHFPGLSRHRRDGSAIVVKFVVLAGKMFVFIMLYMLVRWTIPRFRFDQLMGLAWKVMIPLALVNLVCVMVVQRVRPVAAGVLTVDVGRSLFVGAAARRSRARPTRPKSRRCSQLRARASASARREP